MFFKGSQLDSYQLPGIITEKGPAKLIPKSRLGISVWAMILLEKYLYQRPIARLLESLKGYGLDIPQGTVGDGLKRLLALFETSQKHFYMPFKKGIKFLLVATMNDVVNLVFA
jgi:hypothetical protein